MKDQSHLDNLYFVNDEAYNCPFCNRRHISYSVSQPFHFDLSQDKKCFVFFARCMHCKCTSMHLTRRVLGFSKRFATTDIPSFYSYRFKLPNDFNQDEGLDPYFFYSMPRSFFVLDKRVPRKLRELLDEAEGCWKSNYLTGASACARKLVYELAVDQRATGDDYEARLKSLKGLVPNDAIDYIEPLLAIQKLTSQKVHEDSHDGWDSTHVRVILATLREALREIYVMPLERQERKDEIRRMQSELTKPKKSALK